MDFNFSEQDLAFRREVRDFMRRSLPAELREIAERGQRFGKEHFVRWHRILFERGWAAPSWPVEHGGPGWTPIQKYIFQEELGLSGAPMPPLFGIGMIGPVLIAFGNAEQKQKYLPPILNGDDWWCQGYSEPGSGSDLASLRTKAVRDGDHYVVNGQKIWTSYAHYADRMFCLVRTDDTVKPQAGISFLLIDMTTPGITVRPIISQDNKHSLNEVFFEDVRVPAENLVGEEGQGWTYAKFLLGHERAHISDIGGSKRRLSRLRKIAAAETAGGRPLTEDPAFRRKLADLEVKLMTLEVTQFRLLADEEAGRDVGPAASILKIKGSELSQEIGEAAVEAVGYYGMPYIDEAVQPGGAAPPVGLEHATGIVPDYLYLRALSILGGSNEIQRNILAKLALGL
ncbi:MAG: acyl-CoA dehydrogenase family protein [Rhodospirillales bacterium]|jgi:alkylation response protein AidB-like acyl-CoA dehydrogenase|nr:acyl-CoA dehydrogenase family protein [Rhodospirillales bacterium]